MTEKDLKMPFALDGLIPATIVPMDSKGKIDEAQLRAYLRWITSQSPIALAVNVDTGETAHLSHPERLRILEIAKEETHLPCICGLAGPATHNATAFALDFKQAGADALLVFPIPAYLSAPLDPQIPLRYHEAIAKVGVPTILFQLQPALGGVLFEPDTIARLLDIEGVIGIKEASFDARRFVDIATLIAERGTGQAVLTGNDNFISESFILGATGALIGFGAIMTSQQVDMIAAWQAGKTDTALALGKRIQRLADAVFCPPVGQYRARLKECLKMLGVIESAHVRLPMLPISEAERTTLRKALIEAGLLES